MIALKLACKNMEALELDKAFEQINIFFSMKKGFRKIRKAFMFGFIVSFKNGCSKIIILYQ